MRGSIRRQPDPISLPLSRPQIHPARQLFFLLGLDVLLLSLDALQLFYEIVELAIGRDLAGCFGQADGVSDAPLRDEQVDVAKERFRAGRAKGERLPEGEIGFANHAVLFGW